MKRAEPALSLPAVAPDPITSVVAVEIEGTPEVIPPVRQNKSVTASGERSGRASLNKEHANDGNPETRWAGPDNAREGWVQIDLGQERLVAGQGPAVSLGG